MGFIPIFLFRIFRLFQSNGIAFQTIVIVQKIFLIFSKKPIDKKLKQCYNNIVPRERNKKLKGSDQRRKETYMTNREFYEAVANNEANSAEVIAKAKEEIVKLDNRNLNRKPTAKQKENEAMKVAILEYLVDDGRAHTSAEIAVEMETTTNKVSALCTQLVKEGKIDRVEKKIPKEGKKNFYQSLTATVVGEEEE